MREPTRRISNPARAHRWVARALAALVVTLTAASAAAQARGSLVILGLRAPDGDDDAAANATAALRRAARAAGSEVPHDSPALEQSIATFGCDDSVPVDCLSQIANDQHATRMVYGAVRRHGHGRDAPLVLQVSVYDNGAHSIAAHQEAELARALAQDSDSMNPTAHRLIDALLPAPAPASPEPTPAGGTRFGEPRRSGCGGFHRGIPNAGRALCGNRGPRGRRGRTGRCRRSRSRLVGSLRKPRRHTVFVEPLPAAHDALGGRRVRVC